MTEYLHALPSGYHIEEYELVRILGSGGFGTTYLGYDHHLDKAVAIKEYLPNGSTELASGIFSEKNLREMARDIGMLNVRNISTKRMVLDNWPGAMLKFTGDQQRLGYRNDDVQ